MSLPPIYIINLKRTPERRLNMQRQLDAFGLDYQFVDAIDKLELHSKEYRQQTAHQVGIDEHQMEHLYSNHTIGEGEVAGKLSHIKAYNLMIQHNIPVACILEDDGYLRPTFLKILSNLSHFQELSWDVLMLSHAAKGLDDLIFPYKNLFRFDKLFCHFYKLIHHKKHYPHLQLNSYSVRLIILRGIYQYLRRFFNLHPQYLLSCEIGALPDMKKSSWYKTGFGHYISKPNMLNADVISGMGYILTLPAAVKCKETALHLNIWIDSVFFRLYKDEKLDLRILVPPCVSAIKKYLTYSIRTQPLGAVIPK